MTTPTLTKTSILCVDNDPQFLKEVEKIADALHFTLTQANSIEDAYQKVKQLEFDEYLINGALTDKSGLELIDWIHKNRNPQAAMAFLYPTTTENFREIKERFAINCVTNKPLNSQNIEAILISLYHSCHPIPSTENETLKKIKQEYFHSIYDKIESVEQSILMINTDPSKENLVELKKKIHKIAGSAGSYGFLQVSVLCKEKEVELISMIENDQPTQISPAWLLSLDEFLNQFKLYFQLPTPK